MVTCNFLGNSYSFSQDIFDIHAIYTYFSDEQSKILAVLEKLASTVEKPGMVDENKNDEIVDAFRASATRTVTSLCDKGIVSYTVSDFLDKNPAYAKYQELATNTAGAYMQIVMDTAMSFMNATMAARDSAASTITGSGTGIITNSMAALLLYDAMEAKTINNQIASAEASYKEKLNRISDRSDRKQAEAEQNYKFHKWLPAAQDLIYEFASYNVKQYLQIMCSNGKIRAESVKLIDAARSNELLGNCALTKNKKAVLAQAFQANPFNIEVYKSVFEFGLFTPSEYKTASLLGLEKTFQDFLDSRKKIYFDELTSSSLDEYISFLNKLYALQLDCSDLQSYLSFELSSYSERILNQYQAIASDTQSVKKWVHKNITCVLSALSSISEDELKKEIEDNLLQEEKRLSIEVLLDKKLVSATDVIALRTTIKDVVFAYCLQFRELYVQYHKHYDEYSPLERNLSSCRAELKQCSIFDFKRKKELQANISDLTNELEKMRPLADRIAAEKSKLEEFY